MEEDLIIEIWDVFKEYIPEKNKETHFIKYPIYVGGNRGRGQVYPSGEKSNNNIYLSTTNGKIKEIENVRTERILKQKEEEEHGKSKQFKEQQKEEQFQKKKLLLSL